MNDELIFHHYPGSPFSEKVRLVFGYKHLAWRSVHIPAVMPKPDVVALTGGYRRTPVLQIGADVYCDTRLICQVLEARSPTPPLYPPETAGTAQMLAQWADSALFWSCIAYTMQPAGIAGVFAGQPPEVVKAFAADRASFTANLKRQTVADATAALTSYLGWLEAHLADGRDFLLRGAPSIADFSVAHCLWFVHRAPALTTIFDACPRLCAWLQRVRGFGQGHPSPLDSGEALAIAATSTPRAAVSVQPGLGFAPGDAVTVTPTDYGCDPSAGRLVGLTNEQVTIERHDERAGTLHVHFPRIYFQIRQQETQT